MIGSGYKIVKNGKDSNKNKLAMRDEGWPAFH